MPSRGLLSFLGSLTFVFSLAAPVDAGAPGAKQGSELAPSPAIGPALRLQLSDDIPEPPDLKSPRTDDEQRQLDALSWYLAGQIQQERDNVEAAINAYRRAVELDPESITGYEALIPLLYGGDSPDEAKRLALQGARRTEGGHRLVRSLAAVMMAENEPDEASELLVQALEQVGDESGLPSLMIHRDLGLFYTLQDGKEQAAAEHLQQVFEAVLAPEAHELEEEQTAELLGDAGKTYDQMGQAFLDAKLPDLAVRAFDAAAQHRRARPGIHSFNLATVYHQTGEPEKALAELEKYLQAQLQSKGRSAYELLAKLLEELDRSNELIERLEDLADADPRNATLQYFLADQYLEADRIDEAADLYTETLGNGSDPRGLIGLVAVHREREDVEPLLRRLAELFLRVPQEVEGLTGRLNPDLVALVARLNAESQAITENKELLDKLIAHGEELSAGDEPQIEFVQAYLLGKLAGEAERYEAASQFYNLAISMRNDPPAALFRELGNLLLDGERYAEAVEVFRRAADHPSLMQSRPIFLYMQSDALSRAEQHEEALAVIQEARKSIPDNPMLHFQEAWVLYRAHRWDEASEMFQQIIEQYPKSQLIRRNSRFSLSNIYVQQGDMQQGEAVLLDVLKEEPNHPQVNNDLGYLWADQNKNLERAQEMIEKALAAEPENPAYLDSMGWVLYRLGKYEEAAEYLRQASQKPGGEDSTIYMHLGDILAKLNELDEARQAWEKALEIEQEKSHPDEKILEHLKQQLQSEEAATP